ncbi:hypothetical protein [Yinghuangia seranimata]|uniref:hypothetical protein n=1 Tax=Yinghuangia seranimata TaxID=408067 RepID=UPI00248B604A|nr:hypothetical protein [Yinghuangia seranimata]MDI2125920.1 hypothetical protein [Yinghuangia seranimata]
MALALVLLLGIGLIVFPLADGLPKKTQGVDNVQDTFRDAMSKEGLKTSRDDLVTMQLMLKQLKTETLPQLAARNGQTPEQLQVLLGSVFPAVGKGLKDVDTIMPRFEHLVTVMEQQGPNFRTADEIPTADVPNTGVTYLFLVPGIILTVVGAAGLFFSFRPGRSVVPTIALATSVALGVVMVAGTLATDQLGKTKAAAEMFDAFRPTFTQEGYTQSRDDMNTLKAFADEMQTKAIPFLAAAAKQTPEQYTAGLSSQYQEVGKGLAQTPRILHRFDSMVNDIGTNVDSFHQADSIPSYDAKNSKVEQVPWYILIPGIALILVPGIALLPLGRGGASASGSSDAPANRAASAV